MANEYLKPQIPLKDLNSENYFYPLTTLDQIIIGNSRLSAYFSEDNGKLIFNNIDEDSVGGNVKLDGIIANRTLFVENDSLLSSENIFINNDSLAINTTSITSGYNFEVNGNGLFNGLISASSFFGALAEEELDKTDIRTWCDTVTNIHKSSYQGDMVLKRFYSQDEPAADYNLPCVDSHMMIFSLSNTSINWTRILALDMRSPILFIGGKSNGNWQTWTQLITDNTAQTISGQKTFTSLLKINTNGNTITIGSANTSYCHFENSANIPFYFNRQIQVNGNYKIYNNNTTYNAGWIELSGGAPYIDFHFNNSTVDYTSRIIENASGRLYIPGKLAIGYTNDSYSLATASFICNSWIRTVGNTGWYNESYGGGWYMIDSTYIRNYGSKQVYINARLGVDAELHLWNNTRQITRDARSVSWVKGRDSALLRVSNFNGYSAVWSAKTTNGDWCCGPYNDNILYWSYATDANYNANNNSVVQMRLTPAGYLYAARIYTAVWNDYGEYRQSKENKPGTCVQENDNGILSKTDKRLIPGAAIVSDTYGYAQGKTEKAKTPIAVSGRVLAYTYQDRKNYHAGMSVCSAPNGTIDIMTREEIQKYPDAIIGIVSEIPEYKTWGTDNKVLVDNRIWIKVRY